MFYYSNGIIRTVEDLVIIPDIIGILAEKKVSITDELISRIDDELKKKVSKINR
ncbi:MAG: hypothetical protein PVF73_09225 [Bacteroidales bacterium]|jgi:hypothetical protein